ncbi:MAG: hypothetical protein WC023_06545 [Rhodocyclaceae bacterium]
MNTKDPEHTMVVDMTVTAKRGSFSLKKTTACRVTPKRIYTIGGLVFDRQTGREVTSLEMRAYANYVNLADISSLRKREPA